MTIVELLIAVAIMAVVSAAIIPLFAGIRNSWASQQGAADAIQNGRVLIDHLNRNLSKAVRVTNVSSSSVTKGYIEFEDNDSNNVRYEVGTNNYVRFGPTGALSDLAGPVSQLKFTCYDACDVGTPITDVNSIRFVKVETILTNSASLGQNKTLTTSAYLRTNGNDQETWQNRDIGCVGAVGSASCANGTWTINGSGWGITIPYTNDEFHYVYQPLSGNGQIIARIVSLEDTGTWAKAGVMIRETFNSSSKYAGIFVTPDNGVYFQHRTSTGGNADFDAGSSSHAPRWFKLTRSGSTFKGYESSNGTTWTQVGSSISISMASNVYIGLAVGSFTDGVLCTAVIDNVSFSSITYQGFSEAKDTSDLTSITIPTPSSTSQGDLLIAAVATDGDTSTSMAPPGGQNWTKIDIDDYGSEVTLGAWWKLAGSSEPSSHQFTWSEGQQAYGWMMRFTGHKASSPIHIFSSWGGSSSTPTSPAVTTTVGNCLILRLGAFDDDNITVDSPGLSGHTAITMDESSPCWQNQDIGSVAAAGSATQSESGWTVRGSGTDIWGTSDEFHFVYQQLSGNGQIIARVASITNTNSWAKAGVMIRETLNANSKHALMAVTQGNGTAFQRRTSTGGSSDNTSGRSVVAPYWVRLNRSGSTFTAYDSPNGSTWTQVGSGVSISMASNVYVGLAVTSHNDGVLCTAVFDNITAPTIAGTVSGGAGYIIQPTSGNSGTSTFSLGSSNQARTLTIAIAPDSETAGDSGIHP